MMKPETVELVEMIIALREEGLSYKEIGISVGRSKEVVRRYLYRAGLAERVNAPQKRQELFWKQMEE